MHGGGGLTEKQTTTKSNIYIDNTLIRLIILSKTSLGWAGYTTPTDTYCIKTPTYLLSFMQQRSRILFQSCICS